jgi:hypothetical protein
MARALRPPPPRTPEHEQGEQEHAAILAAIAQDRAQRMRSDAAGNVLLVCFLLGFVIAVAVMTKGGALAQALRLL